MINLSVSNRSLMASKLSQFSLHVSKSVLYRMALHQKIVETHETQFSVKTYETIILLNRWWNFFRNILVSQIWNSTRFCTHSCNFSRSLDQVSHRNNQPLLFFNFLAWYEVGTWTTDIPMADKVDFWRH